MTNPRVARNYRQQGWAAWFKSRRRALGLTMRQLAKRIPICPSYLPLIERDGYVPKYEVVMAIALALDTPVDETLLRAGFAPHLGEEAWGQILAEGRAAKLQPELRRAVSLYDLAPAEQRQVGTWLAGVLAGMAS